MDHIKLNEEEYNLLLNIFIICSKRGVFQIDEYKMPDSYGHYNQSTLV